MLSGNFKNHNNVQPRKCQRLVYFPSRQGCQTGFFTNLYSAWQELDGISEGSLSQPQYDRVIFDFDDDLAEVALSQDIQTRFLNG